MGTLPQETPRYAAFISYAHADEAMATRLHKALETYPVPRHLRAQGKTTKPVFRDVAELTAAHSLSEKIRAAVKSSRVLIVLCSPAAKASHWVNEEIRLFRELHGDAAILSAIIEGTPDTAFPEALTEGGREPLAAALGTDKTGFRLGVTQLAAGMLDTGLDDLVQRGAKRRQRILGAGLAASLALSGVMGFTTLQAVEARKEAEIERAESEALLEYMVKDLKVKLEPVGRLELLEGVGRKAIEYYDKKDINELSDDNLKLLAAARQVLAQVHLDAGRMDEAQREIEAAAALTREVLERNPDDTGAIFAHAQSEFWVGKYYFDRGRFPEVELYWQEYNRLSQRLFEINPNNFDWVMEVAWSANALGAYYDRTRNYENSSRSYAVAQKYILKAIEHSPENPMPTSQLANVLAGKARAALQFQSYEDVDKIRAAQIKLYEQSISKNPQDKHLTYTLSLAKFRYYLDVIRFSKDREANNLEYAIQVFDELRQYDPSKKTWTESAYVAKFYRLDGYYREKKITEYTKYFLDFEKTSESFFRIKENPSRFESLMYELAKIQLLILKDDVDSARYELIRLSSENQNIEAKNTENSGIDARLMLLNFDVENYDLAEGFAKKYLSYDWIKSSAQKPAHLEYKVYANSILKKCSAAKSNAIKLQARNFYSSLSYYIEVCN